jgi:hypothetical protein
MPLHIPQKRALWLSDFRQDGKSAKPLFHVPSVASFMRGISEHNQRDIVP